MNRAFVELSGKGTGLFRGELAFEAALRGGGLRASHPQWDVEVAPDLQLTYADGRAELTGLVELPRAEVRLNTCPRASRGLRRT